MKTYSIQLAGTIFIFASIFGEIDVKKRHDYEFRNLMPCTKDSECQLRLGPKSECISDICVCSVNGQRIECPINIIDVMITQGRQYNRDPFIGRQCVSDADCYHFYAFCNKKKHQCDCVEDYVGSLDNRNCLKIVKKFNSEACYDDAQCQVKFPNATCSGIKRKTCQCRKGYHWGFTNCWKTMKYGENCGDSEECWDIKATCNETRRICICEKQRVANQERTRCLDVLEHMQQCSQSVQCRPSLGEAECAEGHCRCSKDYHYVSVLKKCHKSKILGDNCEDEIDCYKAVSENDDRNVLMCPHGHRCSCGPGFERKDMHCYEIKGGSSTAGGYLRTVLFSSTIIILILFVL